MFAANCIGLALHARQSIAIADLEKTIPEPVP